MCEYAKYAKRDFNGHQIPICLIDNKFCTFCFLGNGKKLKEAKEKERR